MAKFSAGDPVWVRPVTQHRRPCPIARETAAVVISVGVRMLPCVRCGSHEAYELDSLPGYTASGCILRPRRDDYQQHEGLGSMDKITKNLPEEFVYLEKLGA